MACSDEKDYSADIPEVAQEALSFTTKVDGKAASRVYNNNSTRANLEETYGQFRVWCTKMVGASRQRIMDGYRVDWDGSGTGAGQWRYDGIAIVGDDGVAMVDDDGNTVAQHLKYWDSAASSYTFVAVAPKADNTATAPFPYKETTVVVDADGEVTISNIKGNVSSIGDNSENSSGAPDWMVARTVRRGVNDAALLLDYDDIVENVEDIDKTADKTSAVFAKPQDPFADVPLMFRHIFARVDFMAYATNPITVSEFKVYISADTPDDVIINQGDYTTDGGWKESTLKAATEEDTEGQQDPKRFADYHYLPTPRSVGTDPGNPVMLASHVQIPQTWASPGRVLDITITTTDKDAEGNFITYTGTIVLTSESNGSNSWLENRHYTYILKIDADVSNEIILFSVDMETWKWQEGNSKEETQTNW